MNLEWMQSQNNLWIPYHKLFCPGLSKSAPCGCCPSGSNCTTCGCCRNLLPPLQMTDQLYGGPLNFVNSVATNSSAQVQGAANCATPGVITTITTTLTYTLSCHSGPPPYLGIVVSYYWCCSQLALAAGPPCSSFVGSQHFPIATSLDCCNPNFSIIIPQTAGVNPYSSSGTTITVTPQGGANACCTCLSDLGTADLLLTSTTWGGPFNLVYDSSWKRWIGPDITGGFEYTVFSCGYSGSNYGLTVYVGAIDGSSSACVSDAITPTGCTSTPPSFTLGEGNCGSGTFTVYR